MIAASVCFVCVPIVYLVVWVGSWFIGILLICLRFLDCCFCLLVCWLVFDIYLLVLGLVCLVGSWFLFVWFCFVVCIDCDFIVD